MDAVAALTRLGGVGRSDDIVRLSSRRRLRTAVARGAVVRLSRGRYALPDVEAAARGAARLHGVVCHLSAARHWGWEVAHVPVRPHVGIRPDRSVTADTRGETVVHWTSYAPTDVVDGVTAPVRTVLDCARDLPFPEALAVADSALRHGDVTRDALLRAAQVLRGPGAARARRVAAYADSRAANRSSRCSGGS